MCAFYIYNNDVLFLRIVCSLVRFPEIEQTNIRFNPNDRFEKNVVTAATKSRIIIIIVVFITTMFINNNIGYYFIFLFFRLYNLQKLWPLDFKIE